MALLRCSPQNKCTPHNCDPSRPLGGVLFNCGEPLPEQRALPLLMLWRPRPGCRGRRKTHSRPLLSHQLRKLCAKLLIVRVQPFLTGYAQGRHCSQSDLASEEKTLQPWPDFLPFLWYYPAASVSSLGPRKSYFLPNCVKKKSQHNIKCRVSWLWGRRCPLIQSSPNWKKLFQEAF